MRHGNAKTAPYTRELMVRQSSGASTAAAFGVYTLQASIEKMA